MLKSAGTSSSKHTLSLRKPNWPCRTDHIATSPDPDEESDAEDEGGQIDDDHDGLRGNEMAELRVLLKHVKGNK